MSLLDRFRMDGRVVIITGASSGLGVGFAQALADVGADLVLAARRVERLARTRELVQARGRRAIAAAADVAHPAACDKGGARAIAQLGRVNAPENHAGTGTPA